MNLIRCKASLLLVLLLALPMTVLSANLEMKTASDKIAGYVSDIPCVSIKDAASLEVTLEESEGQFRVSDSSGTTYGAASFQEAIDGFLRLKNTCVIQEVKISGHNRISPEAIRFRIKSVPGNILHKQAIRNDIEQIYSMGYFETVDASTDNDILTFTVKEYPVIVSIEIQGNTEIKSEDLLKSISMKKFDILNTKTLKTSIDRIKSQYRDEGYYNAEVDSATKPTEGGIALTFTVNENKKLYIKEVSFDGNEHISDSQINGTLGFGGIIETKDRWWWGMFGHNGSYQEGTLDTDLLRIEQLYGEEGYIKARAGRPIVDIKEDKGIYVTIPIEEGPLFHVGSLDIQGDLIIPKEELMEVLSLKPGDVLRKGLLHKSVEDLRSIFMDQGFAFAQVKPDMDEAEGNTYNIVFQITKGEPVHIDAIHIRGNDKTRDKVVRRELNVDEGDLFSSTAIRESKDNLNRLGYFTNVNVETIPKTKDTMSMLVDVEETTTGAFSFGFAYSSVDRLMGTMQLSENNLFGYGWRTKLNLEYGSQRKSYSADFEEPWLFDRHISLGFGVFNMEREETYYTKKSRGANTRLSYPIFERIRHSIVYSYVDVVGYEDIDPMYRENLSKEEIDGYITSSITNTLYRDTTNDYYRPTRGSDSSVSLEYAGLGGDYHYTRVNAKYAQFFPVYKDKVALMLKFRWGSINPAQGDDLPEDQLYTLGGLNSIRGFGYAEVGPKDSFGNVIGGQRMVVFNAEVTFPIADIPGLSGVFFYDQGNAYDKVIDLTNMKRSYGTGIRWVTPMGPLRVEYGRVINPEEDESASRWDFSIGTFF